MRRDLEPVLPKRRRRQHARLQLRRAPHLLGALGHHPFESHQVGAVLHLHGAPPQVVDDDQVQLRGPYWLHVVRERAVLERGLPQLRVVDPRDHDHRGVRPCLAQLFEEAVSGLVRQPHVQQRHRVVALLEEQAGLGPVEGHVRLEAAAPEHPLHDLGQRLLVVDDQHSLGVVGSGHGDAVYRG
jgi:hypothetical protein